jgi:hypothetical protein
MEIGKTELLKAGLRHREIKFYETLGKFCARRLNII